MLINAHEEERSRLAGEIHDDFSQRLAVLSLGLETAAEGIPESQQETKSATAGAHGISQRDWRRSAYPLTPAAFHRPSRGLASLREWRRSAKNSPRNKAYRLHFPSRICRAPCLLRLRCVCFGSSRKHSGMCKKHSGAAHAQVKIETMGDTLHLSISDDGVGFDVNDGVDRQGLGLWSMRRRVRLVGGRYEIHSEKQKGTRIEIWAPIKLDSTDSVAGQAPETATTSEPAVVRNAGRLRLGATGTDGLD